MALMQHVAEKVLPYIVQLQTHQEFEVCVSYGGSKFATVEWGQNEYVVTFEDEERASQRSPYHTTQPDVAYWKAITFDALRPDALEVTYADTTLNLFDYMADKTVLIPDDQFNGILRAQRTLPNPYSLVGWTGTNMCRLVQRHLLGQGGDARLARQFQADFSRYARIAPDRPREARRLNFLYRGICGPTQQASLNSCGHLESAGFLATSTSKSVAQNFANDRFATSLEVGGGFVARIPIDSIPDGTPWLWYDWDVQTMTPVASEVLLPPGRLHLTDSPTLTFSYVPRSSTSTPNNNTYLSNFRHVPRTY